MGIADPYAAYCLDECCMFMVHKAREGKEPDFKRPERLEKQRKKKKETTNAGALEMLAALGVTVK